jgi:hypothetical protein
LGLTDNAEILGKLTAWEPGQLPECEVLTFFQDLVTCGMTWKFTAAVRQTCALLIHDERFTNN